MRPGTTLAFVHSSRAENALVISIGLVMTGLFLFPKGQGHSFTTYLLTIIVLVSPILWRETARLAHHRAFECAAALLAYLTLSSLWAKDVTWINTGKNCSDLLLVLTFLIGTSHLSKNGKIHIVNYAIILVGAAHMVLSLFELLVHSPDPVSHRFASDLGRLRGPVVTAMAYGFVCMIAIGQALTTTKFAIRSLCLSVVPLAAVAIGLTQSRGPAVAIVLSCLITLIVTRHYMKWSRRLVVPILIVSMCAGITVVLALSARYSPESLLARSTNKTILNTDPMLNRWLDDHTPVGPISVHGSTHVPNISRTANGHLRLYHSGGRVGLVWPAFHVDHSAIYLVEARMRTDATVDRGVFLRVEESDNKRLVRPYVCQHVDHNDCEPATREIPYLIRNTKLTPQVQQFVARYRPSSTANWASVILLVWNPSVNTPLIVDQLAIYKVQYDHDAWFNIGQFLADESSLLARGLSGRQTIWQYGLDLISLHPVFGAGLVKATPFHPPDSPAFEHLHSIFLSTLYYGGIVGLILLCALCVLAFECCTNAIDNRQRPWTPMLALLFGLIVFSVDGGRIMDKVDVVRLLFWYPIGYAMGLVSRKENSRAGDAVTST